MRIVCVLDALLYALYPKDSVIFRKALCVANYMSEDSPLIGKKVVFICATTCYNSDVLVILNEIMDSPTKIIAINYRIMFVQR